MTAVVAEGQTVLAQSHHLRCAGNSEGNGAKVGQDIKPLQTRRQAVAKASHFTANVAVSFCLAYL